MLVKVNGRLYVATHVLHNDHNYSEEECGEQAGDDEECNQCFDRELVVLDLGGECHISLLINVLTVILSCTNHSRFTQLSRTLKMSAYTNASASSSYWVSDATLLATSMLELRLLPLTSVMGIILLRILVVIARFCLRVALALIIKKEHVYTIYVHPLFVGMH